MRFSLSLVALVLAIGLVLPAGATDRQRPRSRSVRAAGSTNANGSSVRHDRDPFLPLVERNAGDLPLDLPPGKAGLIIGRLQLQGLVRASGGVMAVVSTPDGRVFFLRPGDRLYDGEVMAISRQSAVFREMTRDAYGHPLARTVTLRLHSGGGE